MPVFSLGTIPGHPANGVPKRLAHPVPRVAPATLCAGAGGGAPPSSSPSHFTEHDTYDQELGRPMRVKG